MRKWFGSVALLIAASAAPALAHHPFAAEYDWKKPVTITGTVTKFEWQNPHSIVSVKGKDETGTEAEWMVELGSPGLLTSLGWNAHELKNGDQVTVDGWLAKSGKKQLSAKSVTVAGHELAAGSSFFNDTKARATAATKSTANASVNH